MKIKFKRKKNMGFTLIELIAVVAVLAIIMIILIPNISSSIEKKTAAKKIEIENVITAASETYITSYRSEIITGGECYIYVNDLINSDYVSSKDISGYEDAYVIFKKGTEDGYAIKDLKYVTDYNVPECKSNINPLGMSFYKYMKKKAVMDNESSTYVSSSSGIDFTENSSNTNGKGIYERAGTENNVYPIYYFRGEVNDNNVIFADFCFKIVRTTETGGIKMIYNGVASSDGKCNNTGNATEINNSSYFNSSVELGHVGYMYNVIYEHFSKSLSSNYTFSSDVTYNSSTKKYTLTGSKQSIGSSLNSQYNKISNTHYVCLTDSTCGSVDYVFEASQYYVYYITLTGGKKVEDALSEMLDYNTYDSIVKTEIDNWYKTNLLSSYSNYLEDTVFCNDRTIYDLGGWNPDGGNIRNSLYFTTEKRLSDEFNVNPILSCERNIDKFTVSSSLGNGSLDYPIGLLTGDEVALAGGRGYKQNSSFYLYTKNSVWLMSPAYYNANSATMEKLSDGYLNGNGNTFRFPNGIRPVISLKEGTVFNYGDGTADNPYKL